MIIGLIGFKGSGKGTVGDILKQDGYRLDSFASTLKDIVSTLFVWPRYLLEGDTKESREWRETVDDWWSERLQIKNFTPRLGLQLVGTDVFRDHFNNDMWLLTVERRYLQHPNKNVVITDCRFPNEINFIKNLGGQVFLIERGNRPDWFDEAISINSILNTSLNNAAILIQENELKFNAHYSEWAWVGYDNMTTIYNNGSLEDLERKVHQLI